MKFYPKDRCSSFAEIDYLLKVKKLLNYLIEYVKPESLSETIAKAITNTSYTCKL